MPRCVPLAVCAALLLTGCATEQDSVAPPRGSFIGFPSVAAAMSGLRAKPGVSERPHGDWIVLEDASTRSVWTFTRSGQPAHPSAVRRYPEDSGGTVVLKMNVLCEAEKPACDQLVAEFRALNVELNASLAAQQRRQSMFRPTSEAVTSAAAALDGFLGALDAGRFRYVYDRFAPALKASMPFERYAAFQKRYEEIGGGPPKRSERTAMWFKDLPGSREAGLYAMVSIVCTVPKQTYCEERVILQQQPDGRFLVYRHDRDFIEPAEARRMREQGR